MSTPTYSLEIPADPQTTQLRADAFPHLTDVEWEAFQRMRAVIGDDSVINILMTTSAENQRMSALGFMNNEITSAGQRATPGHSTRSTPLKIDVAKYKGGENEPLLRWFVELDAAVEARQLKDEGLRIAFAMSSLAGRAKAWAYGRRLSDPNCFASYDQFKKELRQAFEPPKCEFRARAEFLELRQGNLDLHDYSQRARYLVSSIVTDPIDMATQVVTFMKGLRDSPVRTHLFRAYPKTMDEAINLALQEEFSLKQARLQGVRELPTATQATQSTQHRPASPATPPAPAPAVTATQLPEPEPMEIEDSYALVQGNGSRSSVRCYRCGRIGHIARNCRVIQRRSQGNRPNGGRNYARRNGRFAGPKNGHDQ
jgi:hypothetical protein